MLGGIRALIIAITLFKDLTPGDAVVVAAVVIIPPIFSAIALERKSVDSAILAQRREEIVETAPEQMSRSIYVPFG